MNNDLRRAQASYEEEVGATWRDWCAYLRAQLALIEARTNANTVAFDRDEQQAQKQAQAEQRLTLLPTARRALFDAVRDASREQQRADELATVQRTTGRALVSDPDLAERQVLDMLLGDAEGRGSQAEPGWGMVPLGNPSDWQWFQVDIGDLQRLPDEAAYLVGANDDQRRRKQRLAFGGIGMLLLCGMLWLSWPSESSRAQNSAATVLVNEQAQPTWNIQRITVQATNRPAATMPITATAALPSDAMDGPFWQTSALYPLRLCLPSSYLDGLQQIEVVGDGTVPTRRYSQQSDNGPVDLLVRDCATDDENRVWRGSLTAVSDPAMLNVGASSATSVGTVTLRAVQTHGPRTDSALPDGQLRVVVQANLPAALDPAQLNPTLLIGTGLVIPLAQHETTADTSEYRYLVPAEASEQMALWVLTLPDGQQVRWQIKLDSNATWSERLATDLEVRSVTALFNEPTLTIQVTLHNRSSTALALRPDDLSLASGELTLPTSEISELATPLAPDETRTITLEFDATGLLPLELTLGPQRVLISPP